ncbi:MAG: TonB-dependent receptor [Acidobacteriota bacterium]|nr:TonB-dependent receptor [Acidobacteriota bacterium]
MKSTLSLVVFAMFLVGAQICWGQTSNQGSIVGTVRDQNDNVVPAVTITVVNLETSISRTTTADDRGNYRVDFVPPGNYRIEAEVSGFKRAQIPEVIVHVSEVLRADFQMFVGEVKEEVTVSSDSAAPINTENPTLGEVINERTIQNMPLNGREFLELAALVPGAESGNQKAGVFPTKGVAVGFNGARTGYNAFYVDGADSTDSYFNQLISSPALDAIKEFRVETSLYSARYGRAGGGIINVVTKSGTNQFHGTIYEFHRNKALDARPYFQIGSKDSTPPYLFNQFGGTIGGPIIKKKTFFFFSTEFFRQTKPGQFIEGFAPTAKERAGDFSQTMNPYTGQPVVIVNPYTQAVIPSKILPPELINPVGRKLMDLIPEPNYNDPIFNLRVFRSGIYNQDKYLIKIDHNFNDGSTLNGSYNYGKYDNTTPGLTAFADQNNYDYGKTLAVGYTRALTNNFVSDTKFNYSLSQNGTKQALADQNYAKEYGFWTGSFKPELVGFPRVQLYTLANRFIQIGGAGPNLRDNRTFYLREDLVWVKGTHTFQFGADYKHQNYGWLYDIHNLGAYYFGIFDGQAGQNNNYRVAGHTFANLLTGISSYTNYQYGDSKLARSTRNSIGLYLQDDWKITSRLTLNLGLRYDYEPAFKSIDGKMMTIDFETGLPWYSAETDPALLKDIKYKFKTDGPSRPFEASKLNFGPRVGFAYRPFNDTKTVVRGGYGIVYNSENFYTTGYGSFVAPFSGTFLWRTRAPFQPDRQNHLVPVDKEPFQLPLTVPVNPGSAFPTTPDYPTGNIQHWNLGISRDVGWGIVTEVAYVGSKGTNLNGLRSLLNYDRALYNKVIANVPGWTTVNFRTKGFNSKYSSLQAKANKRFSQGLSFLASFTWSHALAESSNDQIDENTDADTNEFGINVVRRVWSNADFDVRKRFSLSGTYELPLGKGKQFGQNWNSLTDAFLGGWRINTIVTAQDGYPYSVRTAAGRVPDRICDGNLPGSQRTVNVWFDIKCFPDHPARVVVINGVNTTTDVHGNAAPNVIYGPGLLSFDFGLHKEFPIREQMKIQFRIEAFNAFNHPNLVGSSGPNTNVFINTVPGAKITRQRDNRDIQLALKLIF